MKTNKPLAFKSIVTSSGNCGENNSNFFFEAFIALAAVFYAVKDRKRGNYALSVADMLQHIMHRGADFSELVPEFVFELVKIFLDILLKTLQEKADNSREPINAEIIRHLTQIKDLIARRNHDETGAYCTVTAACRAYAQLFLGYTAGTSIGDDVECGRRNVGGLRTMIKLSAAPAATVGRSRYYPVGDILDAMDAKGVFEEKRNAVDTVTRDEVFRRIAKNNDLKKQGFIDKHRNH